MAMLRKFGRLFVIKTRFEAYAVTYAIALGAVERGLHYTQQLPGNYGWVMFAACLGVPFIAGAKLLDSVRPAPAPASAPLMVEKPIRRTRRLSISRSRPRDFRSRTGSASPSRRHTD